MATDRYRPPPEVIAFAREWEEPLSKAIANRMRAVGVPQEMIGIKGMPYEDPGAFVCTHALGGSNNNFPGKGIIGEGPGINVDIAVLDARFTKMSGVKSWASARLKDRIDAVIAHEFTEVGATEPAPGCTPHWIARAKRAGDTTDHLRPWPEDLTGVSALPGAKMIGGSRMSFLHLIYLGDFEHDGEFVRFRNAPDDPILKPVVRRPLNLEEVKQIARQAGIQGTGQAIFPDHWKIWVEEGYLSGDRYALDPEVIGFIRRLVKATGCEVVDFSTRSLIRPEDLVPVDALPMGATPEVVANGLIGGTSSTPIHETSEGENTDATP